MYVLIDTKTMLVKYAHSKSHFLMLVAAIEYPETMSFAIKPARSISFTGYTLTELRLLYENVTGSNGSFYDTDFLIAHLVARLIMIPESEIDEFEAHAQARYVEQNPGQYTYVFGASVPAKVQSSLFE